MSGSRCGWTQSQPDPLLRFALITEPELELSVDIDTDHLHAFGAREGFTDVTVTGGHYRLHRTSDVTLRDPDGRGLLTLEDLRYSTLPDLFATTRERTTSTSPSTSPCPPTSASSAGAPVSAPAA